MINSLGLRTGFGRLGLLLMLLSGSRAQTQQESSTSGKTEGVYAIGNGVTSPKILTRAAPRIPELAQRMRAAGDVLLSLVVQADRTIRDIQVVRSVGYGMDEEAVETVRKWRFAPGTKDGVAVDVRIRAEVGFREAPDPHAWGAGPLVFDLPAGAKAPKLQSGSMPKAVREAGDETVAFQFTLNSQGEIVDMRPLQGEDSKSLRILMNSLSTWKFEPAPDIATPVMGRVLLIKGEDQFRYKVSQAFRESNTATAEPLAVAVPSPSPPKPSSQIITVPVRLRLERNEATQLLVERVPAKYPEAAKRAGVQGNVLLAITIDKDGSVKDVKPIDGPPELVPAAVEAVKLWKYRPAVSRGRTWEATTEVEIPFTLRE